MERSVNTLSLLAGSYLAGSLRHFGQVQATTTLTTSLAVAGADNSVIGDGELG